MRVGARDKPRAEALAAETSVTTDLDPEDPLAGAPGLSSGAAASEGSDKGGVTGALVGALVGLGVGLTPLGSIVGVAKPLQPVADAMLFLALGGIAGAALGNAFGPQRSTHAGFRLVDAMEDGGIGLVVTMDEDRAGDVVKILEGEGATEVTRVAGPPPAPATRP